MNPNRPVAVIVLGTAGSGKSTVARALAGALRAAYLDKDSMVTPLTELLLTERGQDPHQRESNEYYLNSVFPAEYRALLRVAADTLAVGTPVVIDAPFLAHLDDPGYFSRARTETGWPEVRTVVLHVRTDERVVRARVASRKLDRDAWKLAHWDEFWAKVGGLRCTWTDVEHREWSNNTDETVDGLTLLDLVLR